MNDEDLIIGRIRELANLCYQRDIPTYSDFLNLNEQSIASQIYAQLPPVTIKAIGGFDVYGEEIEACERKIIAFLPQSRDLQLNPPINVLHISPLNKKFSDDLSHRDFLGALLNLGIDRSLVGDIFINDNAGYVFCHSRISQFICDNLTRIKHTTVVATIGEFDADACIKTSSMSGTVASVRLDALLSLAFKTSRSSIIELIEGKCTFVNGKLITSNAYNPKDGDIVSVRGHGKFKYIGCSGVSKKGRIVVNIEKYE